MIHSLDVAISSMLSALDRLGIANDTIVVFTSDNGAATLLGVPTNSPLKSGKFTYWEGGLRVPCAMRFPRALAPGQRFSKPISLVDFFATFAHAASAPLVPGLAYDGVDLLDFLQNSSGAGPRIVGPPHDSLFWRFGYRHAVRSGDWKLVLNSKLNETSLYNITADPNESIDLANKFPDVAKSLAASMSKWESENWRDPLWFYLMDLDITVDGKRELWPV